MNIPPETLRQYAVLADGERAAVVGPRGDVALLCAPRWHDDAVFSALLGGQGGYVVRPAHERFVWGGHYESGSLVWRSRWAVGADIVECREALAFPGDPDRVVLLRRAEARRGEVALRVELDCRAGFGMHPMRLRSVRTGVWEGRTGPLHLRWSGTPTVDARPSEDGHLEAEVQVRDGQALDLVLEIATTPFTDDPPDPRRLWADTERAWRTAAPSQPDSMSPRDAQHALAVIRGMTSSTGAVVAAATTSLPERAQQGRDYDYRYAWIRDQCFAGRAVAAAGGGEVLERSLGFIAACLERDGDGLLPAYTVGGDPVPDQRRLDLPGYPGAPDVTVGNRANRQFQLDVLGETLCLFADADRLGVLDAAGVRAARTAAGAIARRHHESDAGIWELADRPWAHSRLIAAAGLRAASARGLGGSDDAAWDALADRLLADVDRTSRHSSGRWCRSPGDAGTDAALLLPGLRGLVAPDDPRSRQTYCSVLEELTEDGYVYRFRHHRGPLGDAEGAFLFCGFLLSMAAHQQGESTLAARLYERNRAAVGPPGVFTEEFDVGQRQLRGNLPQTFVHAALLESAHVLTSPPGRKRP